MNVHELIRTLLATLVIGGQLLIAPLLFLCFFLVFFHRDWLALGFLYLACATFFNGLRALRKEKRFRSSLKLSGS
jgi:hypothetical protein